MQRRNARLVKARIVASKIKKKKKTKDPSLFYFIEFLLQFSRLSYLYFPMIHSMHVFFLIQLQLLLSVMLFFIVRKNPFFWFVPVITRAHTVCHSQPQLAPFVIVVIHYSYTFHRQGSHTILCTAAILSKVKTSSEDIK